MQVTAATKSYFYSAADGSQDIATNDPLTDPWGSNTTLTNVSKDGYSNVIEADSSGGWGNSIAFTGFTAGELSNYDKLVFKVKTSDYDIIQVKVPTVQNDYTIANGIDLGNGWSEVEVDLGDFPDVGTATEMAILNNIDPVGIIYLTDIYVY